MIFYVSRLERRKKLGEINRLTIVKQTCYTVDPLSKDCDK